MLYILDGQEFFLYGVSLTQNFKTFKKTPEFIVVGINNSPPQRYAHFDNNKDKFIGFIKKELRPYIDNNYRTKNKNLLFGWEYAASLGFNILLSEPSLFDAYFLASPYPIEEVVDAIDNLSVVNKKLYFSVSPDENEINHGLDRLETLLTKKNSSGLDWSYMKLEIENHHSTGYPTLYHSLRKYFKYYPEFHEDNLQKNRDGKGVEYAYAYAKESAVRHGFSPTLSLWSKYTIVRSAIWAENHQQFKFFLKQLNTDNFITELIDNNMDSEASSIADFYTKNNAYEKAIKIYKVLLKKHQNSVRLLNKIGNAYKALGNDNNAKKYFKQAQK